MQAIELDRTLTREEIKMELHRRKGIKHKKPGQITCLLLPIEEANLIAIFYPIA